MSHDHPAKLLQLQFTDKQALYNCYMVFCKDGGIFIPTNLSFHLGSSVHLMVEIPGDNTVHAVSAKVVWLNQNKRKGVGVRLVADEFATKLRTAIENTLGGTLKGAGQTFTM